MGRRKGGDREIWWVNRRGFIEGRVYRKNKLSLEERKRRSDFMKEVHRRRQENDPTNRWYARTQDAR